MITTHKGLQVQGIRLVSLEVDVRLNDGDSIETGFFSVEGLISQAEGITKTSLRCLSEEFVRRHTTSHEGSEVSTHQGKRLLVYRQISKEPSWMGRPSLSEGRRGKGHGVRGRVVNAL